MSRQEIWDRRANRAADSFTFHPWRWVIGGIIFLGVLSTTLSIAGVFGGAEKAKLTLKPRVQQRVFTPDNAIAQIAFFHDQCEGVNAQAQITQSNAQRYVDDLRAARLSHDVIEQQQARDALSQDTTAVTGAKNVLFTKAADYNSRSQQSTANVFKGHGLPRRIDVPSSPEQLATFHIDCGPGR